MNGPERMTAALELARCEMERRVAQFGDRERRTKAELTAAAARKADQWQQEADRRAASFRESIGQRYRNATLDNYRAETDRQQKVVTQLRAYLQNAKTEIARGRGVMLFGTVGTGKDHLLSAMGKVLVSSGCNVLWTNGMDLYAALRDTMRDGAGRTEASIVEEYAAVRLWILSDPLPPSGGLTDYQASALYQILDCRYRNMRPTWCSLNVAGIKEAQERLGAAIVDRLRDGALAIQCDWPSYRRSRS
jgi:DNA replication protein DnaC